ncbi:hypothetical protein GGF32_008553 [Allomyces javanicus]|nr:hypothetical protein GGF32_008553 [Allomyces javanicus]
MWTGADLTTAGPSTSLQNPLAAAMYAGTGHVAATAGAQDPSPAGPAPPQLRYELQVVQHPDRCRTCSSDRDRRPMDPPPVLQVLLYDGVSGALLTDPAEYAHLVVQATLWSPDLTVEWTTWNKAVPFVPRPPPPVPQALPATTSHAGPALITPASSHASTPVLPAGLARGTTAAYAAVQPPPPPVVTMGMNHDMFAMAALFDAAMGGRAVAAAAAAPAATAAAAAPAATAAAAAIPSPATPPAPAAAADTTSHLPWSHTIPPPSAQVQFLPTPKRCLLGNTWSSCFHVRSRADNSNLFYFVFPDLGIGADGQFRLQFELVSLGGMVDWDLVDADGDEDMEDVEEEEDEEEVLRKTEAPVLATAVSDVFTAYSPKKFPGMMESTELTNFLRKQGIKIPTRAEGRGSRGDADGEDAPPPRRAAKRARTRGVTAAPAAQDEEDGAE